MPISLKTYVGSSQFKVEFFTGTLTHTLSSATPLIISPPPSAGKTLRLDYLQGSYNDAARSVSLYLGTTRVIDNLALSGNLVTGKFLVSNISGSQPITSGFLEPLLALEPDQVITITTSELTPFGVNYSYSYGE